MKLTLRTPDGKTSERSFEAGPVTLGGSESDVIALPGAPAGALVLDIGPDFAVANVVAGEMTVRGRTFHVRERRLLRAGESLSCFGSELTFMADAVVAREGTFGLALGVLAGALQRSNRLPVPSLVWLTGRDCGKRVMLLDEAVYLGRGDGATARVRDAQASRRHAKIVLRNGEARIVDLESVNGLTVDGEPVQGERRLFGGEVVRIGDTELAFDAELPKPEPAPEPSAAPAVEPVQPPATKSLSPLEIALAASGGLAALIATALFWCCAR